MARKNEALVRSAAWLIALSVAGAKDLQAAKPSTADYPRHAPQLVEQALVAGLAGNVDERTALLKRASDADGNFAPARWQRGQVRFDGQWRTPAEVAKHVAADPRWQEYETLRSEAGETPADHLRLAQWCLRNGLDVEERYHWANVLLANPGHEQARQRLGAQEYQGGLFTKEQVAADKARRERAERDLARFKPKFAQWCREATSDLKVNRDKALAEIRSIDDSAAIPALRDAVRRSIETTAGKRHRSELILAMTAALANMPQHVATLHLVELSVYSSVPEVRQAAAEALRPRPVTDYVPLLMTALQAPIEADVDVIAAPDGTVRMVETIYQKGPLNEVAHERSTSFEVVGAFGRDPLKTNVGAVLNGHLRAASSRAGGTQSQVDAANSVAAERNQRIQQVLKTALGWKADQDKEEDVAVWWSTWQDYNELEYDAAETEIRSSSYQTYTHVYEQAPKYPIIKGDMRGSRAIEPGARTRARRAPEPGTPAPDRFSVSEFNGREFPGRIVRHRSCFAPGTLVWKQSGPTPIEQIRIGDMVLAQHPGTGELAYRPVLETTVGNPTDVLRLKVSNEEIVTTLGHRFWVEGAGWTMAKELPAAAALHAIGGGLAIESAEPAGELECYNLIVDDFHTFVIGKSQILVHDKTCPQPTLAATPGLVDPKLNLKLKQDALRSEADLLSTAAGATPSR